LMSSLPRKPDDPEIKIFIIKFVDKA
jgi:hypothetical protein